MKKITAILEWTKDGYSVWFDELPSVFSYGATVEEAKVEARKAIDLYFEDEKQPALYKNGFEIDVKLDVRLLSTIINTSLQNVPYQRLQALTRVC